MIIYDILKFKIEKKILVNKRCLYFCNTKYTSSTKAADSLAYILQEAVKKVFPRRINKRKAGPRLNPSLTYSHEVQIAKRMYRKVKRKYDKDHNSIDRRQNYIIEKKKYRKVIYRAKKVAQELKLNRLADLENSDPKRCQTKCQIYYYVLWERRIMFRRN